MGRFFRKKRKQDEVFEQITVEEALKRYSSRKDKKSEDVISIADANCERLKKVQIQMEEINAEYDAVTCYLSDIQRIDLIESKEKQQIEDVAEQIINLQLDQKKQKASDKKISDIQYQSFEQLEEDIKRELPRLKQQEEYQTLVREDMRQLEGEKGVQIYEIEEAIAKRGFLKKLSIAMFAVIGFLFLLLILLSSTTGTDLSIPYFMSGIMSVLIIFYIAWEDRKSIYRQKLAEKRKNRVIALMNKVKLKYVNCTAAIEYSYEKYHVNSYMELDFLFHEYLRVKEQVRQLQRNNNELESCYKELKNMLRHAGVEETQSWCYQAEALIDKKEMVEVRHRLNVRRQKLREQLDSNTKEYEQLMNALMELRSNYPQYEEEIIKRIRSSKEVYNV